MGITSKTKQERKFTKADKKLLASYANVQPDNKSKPELPTSAPRS